MCRDQSILCCFVFSLELNLVVNFGKRNGQDDSYKHENSLGSGNTDLLHQIRADTDNTMNKTAVCKGCEKHIIHERQKTPALSALWADCLRSGPMPCNKQEAVTLPKSYLSPCAKHTNSLARAEFQPSTRKMPSVMGTSLTVPPRFALSLNPLTFLPRGALPVLSV